MAPAAVAGASLCWTAPAAAQLGVQVGVVAGTNLVSDSIVERLSVRPNPALAVGLTAEMRLDRYRLGAGVMVSRSDAVRREPLGSVTVTRLTIWQPTLYLRQPFRPWLSGEARASLMIYHPATRAGTFFRSGGPVTPALGAGLRVERRLGRSMAIGLAGLYDLHRFSTPALRADGFTGQTYVHRFTILVSARRVASYERTPG